MFTIRTRIILASLAGFAVVLSALYVIVYRSYRAGAVETLDAQMGAFAQLLSAEVQEQWGEDLFPNAEDLRAVHGEGLDRTALGIYDTTGVMIYQERNVMGLPRPGWTEVLHRGSIRGDVTSNGENFRSLWVPVEIADHPQLILHVLASLEDTEESLARLQALFLVTIPAALLLMGFGVYVIVGSAFRPIRAMIATAKDVNARNLDRRLEVPSGRDEVRGLAETLNGMMERISAAFAAQKRFVADASHEIRTPLAIMQFELEFAAKKCGNAEAQRSIETGLSELDRLKRLSDNLLLLATLEASDDVLARGDMRLDELVAECVRRMRPLADEKKIALNLRIGDVVEYRGDGERLERAVVNLIDNAVKYSPKKGVVEVVLEKGNGEVRIIVSDTGPGIPPDGLATIFDRFRRGNDAGPDGSGCGLGLAIVRRIVELHRGEVRVESTPGRGSIFTVAMPADLTGK